MDKHARQPRSFFFTIRIWPEDLIGAEIKWHGKALFIPSGEICYFRDWPALLEFLKRIVEEKDLDHGPDS